MTTTILVHDFVPWPSHEKETLLTFHGRYVKAMDENDDWLLRQPDPPPPPGDVTDECEWFALHRLTADGNRMRSRPVTADMLLPL